MLDAVRARPILAVPDRGTKRQRPLRPGASRILEKPLPPDSLKRDADDFRGRARKRLRPRPVPHHLLVSAPMSLKRIALQFRLCAGARPPPACEPVGSRRTGPVFGPEGERSFDHRPGSILPVSASPGEVDVPPTSSGGVARLAVGRDRSATRGSCRSPAPSQKRTPPRRAGEDKLLDPPRESNAGRRLTRTGDSPERSSTMSRQLRVAGPRRHEGGLGERTQWFGR